MYNLNDKNPYDSKRKMVAEFRQEDDDREEQDSPEQEPEQYSQDSDEFRHQLGQFTETGSVITNNGSHVIYCLTIIGQIEGHYLLPSNSKSTKYEHLIPQLIAVEENPAIEGMLIILNTVGGDIEAGLALAELIEIGRAHV